MSPEEVSNTDLDMVEYILPHMIEALDAARLAGIPWETVARGMAMAAGIGLAQAYPEPCEGSRVAIMKTRSAITAAYRVATGVRQEIETTNAQADNSRDLDND